MLGRTNTGGGGSGGLNFQVIGGTTAPSNPKENMIWVNTSTKITSYVFSATQPTGSAGMVWISTGTSSGVEFNALKKNGIQVYPISAKQYVSGAWVDVTAKSYQNGKLVDWWNGSLYYAGNEYEFITGGWEARNSNSSYNASGGTLTKTSEYMRPNVVNNASTCATTINQIDLTKYKKLHLTYTGGGNNTYISLAESFPTSTSKYIGSWNLPSSSEKTTKTIDIFGINVPARIAIGHSINIYKVWLE